MKQTNLNNQLLSIPRPTASDWSHPMIKIVSSKSILKKAMNKRLIFTDGKQTKEYNSTIARITQQSTVVRVNLFFSRFHNLVGKHGAPVVMTSVLPFHDIAGSGPTTPEPTPRPSSKETLRPSSRQSSLPGRQSDDDGSKTRSRRESERSLSPTHRLLSGTHAMATTDRFVTKVSFQFSKIAG